jgi:hypothetical protein
MRKPLGPTAMDKTVRFRLTERDLEMLRDLAEDQPLSAVIRDLIAQSYRKKYRKRR